MFCLGSDSFTRKLQFRLEEILNIEQAGGFWTNMTKDSNAPHIVGIMPHLSHLDGLQPYWDYDDKPVDLIIPSYTMLHDAKLINLKNTFNSVQNATEFLFVSLEKMGVKLM